MCCRFVFLPFAPENTRKKEEKERSYWTSPSANLSLLTLASALFVCFVFSRSLTPFSTRSVLWVLDVHDAATCTCRGTWGTCLACLGCLRVPYGWTEDHDGEGTPVGQAGAPQEGPQGQHRVSLARQVGRADAPSPRPRRASPAPGRFVSSPPWFVITLPPMCCAVLCCAVLCCAVLCCAVLCCRTTTGPVLSLSHHNASLRLLCFAFFL